MGLRVRSGYLLTMNLNGAYKVCQDFRAFSWDVTQKVMARRLAERTVFDHDALLLEGGGGQTPSVMGCWLNMRAQYRRSQQCYERDSEVDMETTLTLFPLSTAETLILFQTEVGELRDAWNKVLGVHRYNYDSVSGPEDEDSKEAYRQRGKRWRKVLDEGPGFVFRCLGDSYPTPMRELVLASIPSWEERVEKACTVLATRTWTQDNPNGSFGEIMSWFTSDEGVLARWNESNLAKIKDVLPNPFPVEILYPPEKA